MVAALKTDQRIARLTPLADVLAHIEVHVKEVAPQSRDLSAALHQILADDITSTCALPGAAIALMDGYAVEAEATRDASSYAPIMMTVAPAPIHTGEALPVGTDAVLPHDAVTIRGTATEIIAAATAGDGVLPAGADAGPTAALTKAGQFLRAGDIAVLAAAGIPAANVRAPRIALVSASKRNDDTIAAAVAFIADAILQTGGVPLIAEQQSLDAALDQEQADAVIAVGGTGSGRHDNAVLTLGRRGTVAFHGIAMTPGQTAAVGSVGARPVLLVPGRLDAAFACWLLLGEHLLARLSGRRSLETGRPARLSRKIGSSLGMTDLVPVACRADEAEPLASGYLPLQALARADGWISIPAQSEGYPAGATVMVRPLP